MLTVENLHASFSGTAILKGASVSIAQGEVVGLIGPNGSGKTTLFNTISGFVKQDSGDIRLRGTLLNNLPPFKRARLGIGRVFQNFGIFKEMTLLENILTALESKQPLYQTLLPWGRQTTHNIRSAREFLEQINLLSLQNAKAASLSGGQMRLLEIIRMLAFGAELLLLDEPTAGVSPKMKRAVSGLIQSLAQQGKTIFIIEHDINFIQSLCSRVVVMDGGTCILDDAPEAVRTDPRLHEIYFGSA